MDQIEQLDLAIGSLMRALLVDERRTSSIMTEAPFNALDIEVISYLSRVPASAAKDVAGYLGVRSTTMQSVIDRLQKRGLIQRDNFALKGRAVALSLTNLGTGYWERLRDQNFKNCAQMLACLNDSDRAPFLDSITKIATSFEQKHDKPD